MVVIILCVIICFNNKNRGIPVNITTSSMDSLLPEECRVTRALLKRAERDRQRSLSEPHASLVRAHLCSIGAVFSSLGAAGYYAAQGCSKAFTHLCDLEFGLAAADFIDEQKKALKLLAFSVHALFHAILGLFRSPLSQSRENSIQKESNRPQLFLLAA